MSMSRFLLNSLRNRSAAESFSVLKRYAPSKRFHSSSHLKSAQHSNPNPLLPGETPTSWRNYIFPGALLGGIGGLVFLLHYNDERRAIPKGEGEKFERRASQGPIIGAPFALVDTECRIVNERSLLGNWVLLYFGYTSSPDFGPAQVQKMAEAIDILESKENQRVLPVFVTIDPQRDCPAHLRAYLREFHGRIMGLTGPVTTIRLMAQECRVYFKKVYEEGDDYLIESTHNMYLLNPNMEVVRSFGVECSAEELREAIVKEMKKTQK